MRINWYRWVWSETSVNSLIRIFSMTANCIQARLSCVKICPFFITRWREGHGHMEAKRALPDIVSRYRQSARHPEWRQHTPRAPWPNRPVQRGTRPTSTQWSEYRKLCLLAQIHACMHAHPQGQLSFGLLGLVAAFDMTVTKPRSA